MIGLAMAAALAARPPIDAELRCAASAWQGVTHAREAERRTAARTAYMFFLGRLTAEAPDKDWVPLIAAESKTFIAVPPVGMKLTDLPCAGLIQQIVPLPEEITAP